MITPSSSSWLTLLASLILLTIGCGEPTLQTNSPPTGSPGSDMAQDETRDETQDDQAQDLNERDTSKDIATRDMSKDTQTDPEDMTSTEEMSAGLGLARGLSITQVDAYQSIRVPWLEAGQEANALTPVVAGRETLLRVWVTPDAQWTPQDVTLEVKLNVGGAPQRLTKTARITEASNDMDRTSVLEVRVPGEWMTPQTTISFATLIDGGTPPQSTSPSPSRWPVDGSTFNPGITDAPGALNLVIVPMRFTKNGKVLEPDTSPTQMAHFQGVLEALYPATAINITVRAPIDWNRSLNFGSINSEMRALKTSDNADDDVFYYGLIRPDEDFSSYCSGRCTTGQSFTVSKASATSYFVGSGVGFTGERWAWTLAHEMGHMHGRGHASCGVSFFSRDRNYPHSGGDVGVWGWDRRNDTLWPPDDATDFMGYCDTLWVSDYTYEGIYDRRVGIQQATSLTSPLTRGPLKTWRALTWDARTSPSWARATRERDPTTGAVKAISYYRHKRHINTQQVPHFTMSHDGGAGVMVPSPPKGATHVVIEGRRVALPGTF